MSTKIKNTLFRFVTMRAPELLERENVEKKFVQHPDLTQCYFSQYLADPQFATESKKTNIKNAANYLGTLSTTFDTKEKVKTFIANTGVNGGKFYDFSMWLTSNRTNLKKSELLKQLLLSAIDETQRLSSILNDTQRVALWNNLIYQIITFQSSYVRESILSLLVADFFIQNYETLLDDEKALRKLAQARVIMPSNLFTPEVTTTANKTNKQIVESMPAISKETRKTLEIVNFQDQIAEFNSLLSQINSIEKKYFKTHQKLKKEYDTNFNALVIAAYEDAKVETNVTNPVTGVVEKKITYENLELPTYDFKMDSHLVFLSQESNVTSTLVRFNDICQNEFGYETFEELKEYISEALKVLNQKIFERTSFSQKVVSTGGVVLPVNTNAHNRTTNIFTISSAGIVGAKKLVFSFTGMEAGTDIDSGSYTLTFEDNSSYSGNFSGEDVWINNQLVIKVPVDLSNSENLIQDGDFTLTATFNSSAQRDLVLEGFGTIEIVDENNLSSNPSGTNPYDLSSNPNSNLYNRLIKPDQEFIAIGRGAYDYKDAAVVSINPGNSNPPNNGSSTTSETVIDYIPSGFGIKRLGITDYRKVEQEVCCYVPGEVSHIENVMAREYKEKSTRRLRRSENTTTLSSESETEKLSDTTSTDRFEMNQEIGSVLAEQNSFGATSAVNQDWGSGSITAGADFATNTSQEESNHQAVTNAKEVTERALERVVQKVKEERITKIIEEFEENSKHGYDNRKGDKHVSGVYRWVDKIFRNRVINYGKRLMYEIMIPEPASFHNTAISGLNGDISAFVLEKPKDPRTQGLPDFNAVAENTYAYWGAVYNVEIETPKKQTIYIGKSLAYNTPPQQESPTVDVYTKTDTIRIPEGYVTKKANLKMFPVGGNEQLPIGFHTICCGNVELTYYIAGSIPEFAALGIPQGITESTGNLKEYVGEVPITYSSVLLHMASANVEVECVLTEEAKKQWQIETFNAIITAYEAKLADYNAKLDQLKAMQTEKVRTNPLFYRKIENTVLRKNCIDYLMDHLNLGSESLLKGTSDIKTIRVKYESDKLESYAAKVKFFEQAFEWDLMSYHFYPFYWAHKDNWKEKYNVDETDDHIFRAFLQSGMARVILSIRPGFEEAVNWYMATGQIWNGGQVPTIDDPLFISIVEELRETEGEVEETWESRVPTSLTVIQAGSIGLNVQGLPCDDNCSDFKLFDSDGNQVFNPDGTPVSTNPIQQNPEDQTLGNVSEDIETVTESIEEIKADIEEIKATLAAGSGN